MTIVIGVLCENGKSAIIIADRMLTFGKNFMQAESIDAKFCILHNRLIIGSAGDATRPIELIFEIESSSESSYQDKFSNNCEKIKNIFREKRIEAAEEAILLPHNLSFAEFKGSQKMMDQQLVSKLWSTIYSFEYNVALLIIGHDDSGCHIATISDPGKCTFMDDIGYATIGSGAHFATSSLALEPYDIRFPLHRALASAYFAKKMSEKVPGVGTETDISILYNEKIYQLSSEKEAILSNLYKEYQAKLSETISSLADGKKEELEEFKNE